MVLECLCQSLFHHHLRDVDGRIIYAETVGKHTTHGSKLAQVIANEIRFNARQNAIGTPGAKTRNLVTSIFKQAEEASTAAGVNLGPTIKEESMARFLRKAKAKQVRRPSHLEILLLHSSTCRPTSQKPRSCLQRL